MFNRPINSRWAGGVMRHQDDLSELQLLDHGVQVSLLILSGVRVARRLIRRPPPEKIKCHYSTRRRKIGKKAVVKMKIVWKAMHQNDRRFGAVILSGVNAVLASLYKMFLELHDSVPPRITDPAAAPDTAATGDESPSHLQPTLALNRHSQNRPAFAECARL